MEFVGARAVPHRAAPRRAALHRTAPRRAAVLAGRHARRGEMNNTGAVFFSNPAPDEELNINTKEFLYRENINDSQNVVFTIIH